MKSLGGAVMSRWLVTLTIAGTMTAIGLVSGTSAAETKRST